MKAQQYCSSGPNKRCHVSKARFSGRMVAADLFLEPILSTMGSVCSLSPRSFRHALIPLCLNLIRLVPAILWGRIRSKLPSMEPIRPPFLPTNDMPGAPFLLLFAEPEVCLQSEHLRVSHLKLPSHYNLRDKLYLKAYRIYNQCLTAEEPQ